MKTSTAFKAEIQHIQTNKLIAYENNVKQHPDSQVEKIIKSIAEFGFTVPLIIDSENVVIAGHGRLEAAKRMHLKQVPCIVRSDLSPAQIKALRIADNKIGESPWDDEALKAELEALAELDFDLTITGWDAEDLLAFEIDAEFQESQVFGGQTASVEEDEETVAGLLEQAEEGAIESRVKLGEIWQLGRHRICCGDSTVEANVRKLLGKNHVDCMVTDPPYGVDYSSKNEFLNKFDKGNRNQTPIKNDAIEDYESFFMNFLIPIPFAEYNTCYIFMSDRVLHLLRLAFEKTGFTAASPCYLVWAKNNHVLGRSDYSAKHELILYGWKNKHKFYGDFSTTVIEFDKPLISKEHPTMKPVDLIQRLFRDGSDRSAFIYEPFCGSGTAILAAESMEGDRTVYGFELSPDYCEVIIQRWEKFTGKTAQLIGTL